MHNKAREMAMWAMKMADKRGYDNMSAQNWEVIKNAMCIAKDAAQLEKDALIIDEMEGSEKRGYNGRHYANGRFAPRMGYQEERMGYGEIWPNGENQGNQGYRMGYEDR